MASLGITIAASTSPSFTIWIASSRVSTRTGSMASNSGPACSERSICSPPREISFAVRGTRFTKATSGLSGPRDRAKPISVAMITG